MTDPATEACRRVRDEIVEHSGGFDGYFNQLEELDRQRLAEKAAQAKNAKKPTGEIPKRNRKRLA